MNWGWFAVVVGLTAIAVPLFPFEDISFDYIMRPQVLRVMRNTVLIAGLAILMVGLVAYPIHVCNLWDQNVLGAIAVHGFLGIGVVFYFVVWMIDLLYGEGIVDHHGYQYDLIFVVCLLVLLNFWMRIRIEVSSKTAVRDELRLARAEMAEMRFKALEKDTLIASLSSQNEVLQGEEKVLKEHIIQKDLDYGKLRAAHQLLEKEAHKMKKLIKKTLARSPKAIEEDNVEYLEIETATGKILLSEYEVSYAEGRKEGQIFVLRVVCRKGKVYFPNMSSLNQLQQKVFSKMKRLSRNYAVMLHSIVDYEIDEKQNMQISVEHLDTEVEISGQYLKRNRDSVIQEMMNRTKE
ncbi:MULTISPECIES: LytTR family transcriptional regulator DNA-binding domain-containing protein [Sphingobacterium]|uniref:LytTR family transcriptional regulator DNA-binding domain-containing protein n=1 Tax=Sphingobacterium TaxID=28453 RepID=UPI0013DB297D|nr:MULTISPECIES: LytTR family transcriptional regulator DNA-binding domain-containing protein [unclassified Sphingobacterium]